MMPDKSAEEFWSDKRRGAIPGCNFGLYMTRHEFKRIESAEVAFFDDPTYPRGPADPQLLSEHAGNLFDSSSCGADPFHDLMEYESDHNANRVHHIIPGDVLTEDETMDWTLSDHLTMPFANSSMD